MFCRPPALPGNTWWYHSAQKIILLLTGSAMYQPKHDNGSMLLNYKNQNDTQHDISQRH